MGLRRWLGRQSTVADGDPAELRQFWRGASLIRIGRYSYGAETLELLEWGEGAGLSIGAFCSIAPESEIFLGGNHRLDWATAFPFGHVFTETLGGEDIVGHPASRGDVVIGNDVWLGRGVRIMSGVKIGDGAVVAAGSVVARDIGPYEIWGGNPARLIRARFAPEICQGLQDLQWWDWPEAQIRQAAPLLSQTPNLEMLALLQALKPLQCGGDVVPE